jgi:wyosine [tRNA(Phe)-imidazoG37] synthetase (radical SAM superfamily)
MRKHIFGPVPSRRLGISLGIDVVPKKVCTLNCVYCEVGATDNLTVKRREYVPYDEIVAELDEYFSGGNSDPDTFTFSGSGEPTLNSRIGEIILYVKQRRPDVPVAVLTNGTLLSDPSVREELLPADIIIPSLDAVREKSFRRINCPHPDLVIESYIQGLIDLRNEYKGRIYLEVFVLPGFNMANEDLEALRAAIVDIRPDKIQINTLDRPGVISGLRAATAQELQDVRAALNLPAVEIIAAAQVRKNYSAYRTDISEAILETIRRRPCTLEDLTTILDLHTNEVNKYLDVLESEDVIETVSQDRGSFYQIRDQRSEAGS